MSTSSDASEKGIEADEAPRDKVKVSWVYKLNKEALEGALTDLGQDTTGTVDDMRQRLTSWLRSLSPQPPEDVTDVEFPEPPPPPEKKRTDVMDRARKWNVHFDGTGDAVAFLERVHELAEGYGFNQTDLLAAATELLRGTALLWYRNNRPLINTWSAFTREFQAFFFPRSYQKTLLEQITNRKQRTGERARTYVLEMQTLMRRNAELTTEAQLERIYANLATDYKYYIRRRDFADLNTLIELCDEYEELQGESRQQNSTLPQRKLSSPRVTDHTRGTPAMLVIQGYNRRTCCWRCGRSGHSRPQCRWPSRLFCSFCGMEGTQTKDCACHQGNL